MRTTIDAAGRLVIPKALRERLGLSASGEVDVDEHDGVVEIRPAQRGVTVDRSGARPILRTSNDVPPLTDEEIRDLLDQTRR
ncbi:MAG TPA: AbrB/MazE/SpoVT family DNA-binding domain-containing protein [Jiangellaceae bacterium]|jgi:AbrB family looped-hinge helix DNA binding protein|nr:AbrB/MazE/SpoVT family DNA-binding domain-containing protein [Jiangellaceae bacterium]